jgi:hypothetical protein
MLPMSYPNTDDGRTVSQATAGHKTGALVDELVAVARDTTLPWQLRAGAVVASSDALEAARTRGQRAFVVLGTVTAEPELLLAAVLFQAVPASLHVRGAARAARRAATN